MFPDGTKGKNTNELKPKPTFRCFQLTTTVWREEKNTHGKDHNNLKSITIKQRSGCEKNLYMCTSVVIIYILVLIQTAADKKQNFFLYPPYYNNHI